ncbi:MAG: hypothetical protein COV55_00035 [Candidatus Komeilibacteria bacterium CG11_big_fil_rev_8_21_14_0_20_36_20]|uniref:Band 7 domain-containing protein n=1 Tax=Candidatus Komeilibacteria bacterium CG11_big_fil_rev_8_21_14_0_20_36_20 TaxID=1974477 RepID=A0A2H0NEP3_9BACT|nr:MAG: hypothetical protein COV55_00035 [Candidatus Komeilibacteria bacterium CG11_big_fil_rev_8_21_14_0_20_36_20]PIR81192.1 MAG: hypothetical protein COU21_04975 [Candidatus Komeilibacteria bacterium CG10_big_fil_rev_8_21_14_0_10_36_65]PJC55748.1 MAG: hypothetical protein CO027_00300 [Candidatus Komeilibacteria bacterium CG_4_9_14_0_2_um_filter_36_13]
MQSNFASNLFGNIKGFLSSNIDIIIAIGIVILAVVISITVLKWLFKGIKSGLSALNSTNTNTNQTSSSRKWWIIGCVSAVVLALLGYFTFRNYQWTNIPLARILSVIIVITLTAVMLYRAWIFRRWLDEEQRFDDNKNWQGIVSAGLLGFSLATMIIFGLSIFGSGAFFVILSIVAYLLGCVHIVPIRRIWVITWFDKPVYSGKWFLYPRTVIADKFMDNGLNIASLPSWFPGFGLISLPCHVIEEEHITDFLPTRGLETEVKGKLVEAPAGVTVKVRYRTMWRIVVNPKVYLGLSTNDRQTITQVILAAIDAVLAGTLNALTIDEVLTPKFFNPDGVAIPPQVPTIVKHILTFTGCELIKLHIMDVTPETAFEESLRILAQQDIELKRAIRQVDINTALGEAAGKAIQKKVEVLAGYFGIPPEEAYKLIIAEVQAGQLTTKITVPENLFIRKP